MVNNLKILLASLLFYFSTLLLTGCRQIETTMGMMPSGRQIFPENLSNVHYSYILAALAANEAAQAAARAAQSAAAAAQAARNALDIALGAQNIAREVQNIVLENQNIAREANLDAREAGFGDRFIDNLHLDSEEIILFSRDRINYYNQVIPHAQTALDRANCAVRDSRIASSAAFRVNNFAPAGRAQAPSMEAQNSAMEAQNSATEAQNSANAAELAVQEVGECRNHAAAAFEALQQLLSEAVCRLVRISPEDHE